MKSNRYDPVENAAMQIIVTGMHRSGTSVLTNLVHLMGAQMGSVAVMDGPSHANPRGHWERIDIQAAHTRLLHAVGREWYHVLRFSPSAIPEDERIAFSREAQQILAELGSHRLSALKDPRFCMLLPLWKPWLADPFCLFIYRDPIEVAQSLENRNGFPLPFGVALWEHYNLLGLRVLEGFPHLIVSHEAIMREPATFASEVYEKLTEAGVPGLRQLEEGQVLDTVDPRLHRFRGGLDTSDSILNDDQRHLLALLQQSTQRPAGDLPAPSEESTRIIEEFGKRVWALYDPDHGNGNLSLQIRQARSELERERRHVSTCVDELEEALGKVQQSWSWRLGYGLFRRIDALRGRKHAQDPMENLQHIVKKVRPVSQDSSGDDPDPGQ